MRSAGEVIVWKENMQPFESWCHMNKQHIRLIVAGQRPWLKWSL